MAVNPTQRSQSNHFAPRISLLGASRNIARKRRRRHELMALSDAGFSCIFLLFFGGNHARSGGVKTNESDGSYQIQPPESCRGGSRPSKAAARAFLFGFRRPVRKTPKGQGVDASSLLFALFWEKKAEPKERGANKARGREARSDAGRRAAALRKPKKNKRRPPPPRRPVGGSGGEGSAFGFQRAWPWMLSAAVLAAGLSHASTSSASSFSGSKSTG